VQQYQSENSLFTDRLKDIESLLEDYVSKLSSADQTIADLEGQLDQAENQRQMQ
jgi:hypothetical protein